MKKRTISAFLASLMLVTALIAPASAFSDTKGHWAEGAIDRWSGYGVITGYPDGTFAPGQAMSRGQLMVVLRSLFGWSEPAKNKFSDLKGDEWYANAILCANEMGVLQGSDGRCNATATVSRQEAAVMLRKALYVTSQGTSKTFVDRSQIAAWAMEAVNAMSSRGFITGTPEGTFQPQRGISRAEIIAILNKAIGGYYAKSGSYSGTIQGLAVVAAPDVTLYNMTIPQTAILAPGATGWTVLRDVTAQGTVYVQDQVRVRITGKSVVNDLVVDGDQTIVKVEGSAKVNAITVTGSTVLLRGLPADLEVTVAADAKGVLVNGHEAVPGTTVKAGRDISTDADEKRPCDHTYEEFMALTAQEKDDFIQAIGGVTKYMNWLTRAKADYEARNPVIDLDKEGAIDFSQILNGKT